MKKIALCGAFIIACFIGIQAQPRIIEKKPEVKKSTAIAPTSFKVKYEGGMFGFSKKQEGTMKFDDANFRVVFFDKDNKEQFGIPYSALIVIYPNTQSVQSTTGKVVQYVPYIGLAGQFMKKKMRYLVTNFDDQDMDARGTVNFKLDSTELLESAIQTLGSKAEMQARGDAYYRPKKAAPTPDNK